MLNALTPSEIVDLKKALASFEKQIRHEAKFRWLQLLLALLFVACAFYLLSQAQESAEAFDNLVRDSLEENKAALLVDRILQIKVELLRSEFRNSSSSLIIAVGAGMLFGGVFVQWSRRSRDLAQVMLIRALLEAQTEPPNKSLNADTGDAGAG